MKSSELERLEKLNELRSKGALTDAEFTLQKEKLLRDGGGTRWPYVAGAVVLVCGAGAVAVWTGNHSQPQPAPATLAVHAAPSPPPPPTPTPPPIIPPRSPAARLTDAFTAATGHRRPFIQTVKNEAFTVSPVRIVELPFGPALIVKREIKDGCHACSGYLGVYYLREDGSQTVVTGSYPEAVSGWGWGAAPSDWQLTTRFTSRPAIYASGGYMGQGIVMSSSSITELRPDGPKTSDLIGTGYSDKGAFEEGSGRTACDVEGKIVNIVKDRSFDVVSTGSLVARDRYVMRSGKFAALKKTDWGLPCGSSSE